MHVEKKKSRRNTNNNSQSTRSNSGVSMCSSSSSRTKNGVPTCSSSSASRKRKNTPRNAATSTSSSRTNNGVPTCSSSSASRKRKNTSRNAATITTTTASGSRNQSNGKFNFKKLKGKKPPGKGKNKVMIKFSPPFSVGQAKEKIVFCTIDFLNYQNSQLIYMKGNYLAHFFEFVMTELGVDNGGRLGEAIKNASSYKVTDDNRELVCNQTEKDGRVSVYNQHCCVICFKSVTDAWFEPDAIVDYILNLITSTKSDYVHVMDAYKQVVASLMNNGILGDNFSKIIEGGWKKDLVLMDNGEYSIEVVVQKDVACLNNCFEESLHEVCSRYFSEYRQEDVIDALRTNNVV